MVLIVSEEVSPSLSRLSSGNTLSEEISVLPAKLGNDSLPNILTFHSERGSSPRISGAWENGFLVHPGRSGAPSER